MSPSDQTVVFTATRHHVDYLNELYAADRDNGEQLEGDDVYTMIISTAYTSCISNYIVSNL